MRKNVVAGNWKMNTTLDEGVELANNINAVLKGKTVNCDVVICVPFTHLTSVNAVIEPELVKLGAEDCSAHEKGAYTGEVSAPMVKSTGATHVILGHSERRQYHGENNEQLLAKTNGSYNDVVKGQVEALFELSAEDFGKIIIAYEPVWAIGTGKTATAEQAQDMHAHIRKVIEDKYGKEVADNTSILYGGSCKPTNAKELFAKPDVDGGLIGGAALDAESFLGIIEAC